MFGGGKVTEWTHDQLTGLARAKVLVAIRDGHGAYAKTMTRELLRLALQARGAVSDEVSAVDPIGSKRPPEGSTRDK